MALICLYGKECNGCMDCYEKELDIGCCLICGQSLYNGDQCIQTPEGFICLDCAYAYSEQNRQDDELYDYINDFADDFIKENKWELIEAAVKLDFGKSLIENFVCADKECFSEWWLEKQGLEKQTLQA